MKKQNTRTQYGIITELCESKREALIAAEFYRNNWQPCYAKQIKVVVLNIDGSISPVKDMQEETKTPKFKKIKHSGAKYTS